MKETKIDELDETFKKICTWIERSFEEPDFRPDFLLFVVCLQNELNKLPKEALAYVQGIFDSEAFQNFAKEDENEELM